MQVADPGGELDGGWEVAADLGTAENGHGLDIVFPPGAHGRRGRLVGEFS